MFFVDANVLAYALTDSPQRPGSEAIVRAVGARLVQGRTSTAVLEEILHLELRGRPRLPARAAADYFALFSPLVPITDEIFERALALELPDLGTNDRVHAATCLEMGIRTIVSADAAFDTVRGLRRVDPLDTRAVDRLLV